MREWRTLAQVPADHPSLPGHFPGNPIVPAVVLMECVLSAVRAWRGQDWQLRRLRAAKFLLPLRPDERFDILLRLTGSPPRLLDWRCERDAGVLAQGTWEVGAAP